MSNQDDSLRQIAKQYVAVDGETLLQEAKQLDYDTTGLKRKVDRWRNRRRNRRIISFVSGVAACFIIFLLLPKSKLVEVEDATSTAQAQPIALNFALPDNFSESGFEQDNEKSIYYLEDKGKDDVVMTLEYAQDVPEKEALVPLEIDGYEVYGRQTGEYSLLAFCKDDVLYTLTCRHDINTIAQLSSAIL